MYKKPLLIYSSNSFSELKLKLTRELEPDKEVLFTLPSSGKIKDALDKLLPNRKISYSVRSKISMVISETNIEVHADSSTLMGAANISFELLPIQKEFFKSLVTEVVIAYGLDGVDFIVKERPVG